MLVPICLASWLAASLLQQDVGRAAPAARAPSLGLWHELVFHERAGKLLLLNGGPENGKPGSDPLELWEWTGADWVPIACKGPRWRNQASAAYDSKRDVLVLYGGVQPGEDFADTWEWDGEVWSERDASGPGPREASGMTFDAARGTTVLFGGAARGVAQSDTWAWDGDGWTRASSTGPSARFPAGFVYDEEREVVLLFGGHTIDERGFRTHADTWIWDGAGWESIAVGGPSARDGARSAFDPRTRRVLLFGGAEIDRGVRILGDLWSWNGSSWTPQPDTGIRGRVHGTLAFDARRGRLVLTGGSNAPGSVLSDVWEHDGRGWSCVFACP